MKSHQKNNKKIKSQVSQGFASKRCGICFKFKVSAVVIVWRNFFLSMLHIINILGDFEVVLFLIQVIR